MKPRYLIAMLLALVVAAPVLGVAQERDQEREERVREAEQRLEEARGALEDAIRQIRGEQDEARRSLERAMRQLRQAQGQLLRDGFRDRMREFVVLPDDEGARALVRVFGDDRPRMGVILESEDDAAIDSIGARIQAVTPAGPADEAGIEAGDIVLRVDGEPLGRRGRRGERPGVKLARLVREHDEGDTLRVEYRRGNETRSATVALRQLEPDAYAFGWSSDSNMVSTFGLPRIEIDRVMPRVDVGPMRIHLPLRWLDMELATLDAGLGAYFGTSDGLLVVRAPSEASLNLQSGDVILSIDGRPPTSASHALRIMRSYDPGETMKIEIMRSKRRMTITAMVPERN
jgi:S1-C subfamily serine protease